MLWVRPRPMSLNHPMKSDLKNKRTDRSMLMVKNLNLSDVKIERAFENTYQ